jgi:hypothetical protein
MPEPCKPIDYKVIIKYGYVFLSILLFVLVGLRRFRGRHFLIVSLQDVGKHGI